MKINIGFTLVGIIVGAIVSQLYFSAKANDEERHANELIDFVISQWTQTSENEVIESNSTLAQISSSKISILRTGQIPDTIRTLAYMIEAQYKVPRAVTLAQYILESRWGKNDLGANNVFGHTYNATKKYMAVPRFVLRKDKISVNGIFVSGPERKFARYTTVAECFATHGKYLSQSPLYSAAFYTSTPESFVRVLALHYAQDPDYGIKLITIIRRYKLA